MMKLFAVRDVKADSFGNPITVQTVGVALRSFTDACNSGQSDLNKYPEDYMLYEIGTYDPASATVLGHQTPKLIATASGVISEARKQLATPYELAKKDNVPYSEDASHLAQTQEVA